MGQAELVAVLLPFALLFGGLAQLLAGMWEFRNDDTFGAAAFTSYGAFWISYFFYSEYVAGTLHPAEVHIATGIFRLTWTIFTIYMTLAALKTNVVLIAIFGSALVTFVLLTVGRSRRAAACSTSAASSASQRPRARGTARPRASSTRPGVRTVLPVHLTADG